MMNVVSAHEVKQRLNFNGPVAVLDVREHGQYGEGHLLFASNCPYSVLEMKAPSLVPDLNTDLILYDDGDGVASRAAERLQAFGYAHVSVMDGGASAWTAANYTLFKGVNVPSKVLGELVESACHTPTLTADDLNTRLENDQPLFLVDGRPISEYVKMTVPGARSVPNGELLYRIDKLNLPRDTPIVIHCAGRTRGLIGAQSLINAGVRNPVYALENGTQGWALSGRQLLRGADAERLLEISTEQSSSGKEMALSMAHRYGVPILPAAQLASWKEAGDRTAYVLDVRTKAEFDEQHVPGAQHASTVQLVQATDEWIAMRRARVALLDDNCVRAVSAAMWLRQMGHDVVVVENAMSLAVPRAEKIPADADRMTKSGIENLTRISVQELIQTSQDTLIVDVRSSQSFRQSHIAGSVWSIRPRIANIAGLAKDRVIFVADCAGKAALAAQELRQHRDADMALLDGGVDAWISANQELETGGLTPDKSDSIDFLYFVHDRHSGNLEASRHYLEWETGLVSMLDADERATFAITHREH